MMHWPSLWLLLLLFRDATLLNILGVCLVSERAVRILFSKRLCPSDLFCNIMYTRTPALIDTGVRIIEHLQERA